MQFREGSEGQLVCCSVQYATCRVLERSVRASLSRGPERYVRGGVNGSQLLEGLAIPARNTAGAPLSIFSKQAFGIPTTLNNY